MKIQPSFSFKETFHIWKMQVVTINSIQSLLSIFIYIFSVDAHKHLRDRTYSHFTNKENRSQKKLKNSPKVIQLISQRIKTKDLSLQTITKLNKSKKQTNKPKQEQQLQPIKALAMCFYHMYVLHVYTFVYR